MHSHVSHVSQQHICVAAPWLMQVLASATSPEQALNAEIFILFLSKCNEYRIWSVLKLTSTKVQLYPPCYKACKSTGRYLLTGHVSASSFGSFYPVFCDSAIMNYWHFAECYFSPQTSLMVLYLPGTPFIPFYFINPYSSLKIQPRCDFLLLPGWVTYFILLYISIRVISTLNQFVFICMTRLHALRARTVSCLPLTSKHLSTGPVQYIAAIQLPKHMHEAERTVHIEHSIYFILLLDYVGPKKYRSTVFVRK